MISKTAIEEREPRAYRIDQIRSVRVLDQSFSPTFRIEVSSSGAP